MTFIPVTAQHDENMPNNLYKNTKITIWKITVLFHCFYIPIVGICYSNACVLKQGSCLFSFLRAKSFYNQTLRQRIHSSKGSVQPLWFLGLFLSATSSLKVLCSFFQLLWQLHDIHSLSHNPGVVRMCSTTPSWTTWNFVWMQGLVEMMPDLWGGHAAPMQRWACCTMILKSSKETTNSLLCNDCVHVMSDLKRLKWVQ